MRCIYANNLTVDLAKLLCHTCSNSKK